MDDVIDVTQTADADERRVHLITATNYYNVGICLNFTEHEVVK